MFIFMYDLSYWYFIIFFKSSNHYFFTDVIWEWCILLFLISFSLQFLYFVFYIDYFLFFGADIITTVKYLLWAATFNITTLKFSFILLHKFNSVWYQDGLFCIHFVFLCLVHICHIFLFSVPDIYILGIFPVYRITGFCVISQFENLLYLSR